MRFKVGDRVRIKSLDWYNENKDEYGYINCGSRAFFTKMSDWCGKIVTIKEICKTNCYHLEEYDFDWTDEMIEGLVEEENNDCKKCGLTRMSTRCLFMDNCPHNKQRNIIEIPKDYILKDENGNVINATKIVWEKKKKEYPKTYEECCEILDIIDNRPPWHGYRSVQLKIFQKLLICRDAYWKIAGEDMGLGKPWEPNWTNEHQVKYTIYTVGNDVIRHVGNYIHTILAFPTEEMQDAFYENFKELIEQCKELL